MIASVTMLLAGLAPCAAPALPTLTVVAIKTGRGEEDLLTDTFATAAQRTGVFSRVVSHDDTANVLAVDQQRQLIGCETEACILDVAGLSATDYVLFLRFQPSGDALTLTVRLVEVKTGAVLGAATRTITAESSQRLFAEVPEIVAALVRSACVDDRVRTGDLSDVPPPSSTRIPCRPEAASPASVAASRGDGPLDRAAAQRLWFFPLGIGTVFGCAAPMGLACGGALLLAVRYVSQATNPCAGALAVALTAAAVPAALCVALPSPFLACGGGIGAAVLFQRIRASALDHVGVALVGALACGSGLCGLSGIGAAYAVSEGLLGRGIRTSSRGPVVPCCWWLRPSPGRARCGWCRA